MTIIYSQQLFLHLVCEVQSLIVKQYHMLHETVAVFGTEVVKNVAICGAT